MFATNGATIASVHRYTTYLYNEANTTFIRSLPDLLCKLFSTSILVVIIIFLSFSSLLFLFHRNIALQSYASLRQYMFFLLLLLNMGTRNDTITQNLIQNNKEKEREQRYRQRKKKIHCKKKKK